MFIFRLLYILYFKYNSFTIFVMQETVTCFSYTVCSTYIYNYTFSTSAGGAVLLQEVLFRFYFSLTFTQVQQMKTESPVEYVERHR